MSENNMKTEIRKGTKSLNSISDDRVIVFFPEMFGGTNIAGLTTTIKNSGEEDLSNALSLPETLRMILSAVANIRRRLRFEGFKTVANNTGDTSATLSAVYFEQDFDDNGPAGLDDFFHYFRAWYRHFMKGFEGKKNSASSNTLFDRGGTVADVNLTSSDTRWDDDPTQLVQRWAYIKGVEYSPFMEQIVATGNITADERKDFRTATFLLSVDALEEWINTYVDAIIQSEKALLNIGKARLSSLSRTDLLDLFNDDINIPRPLLELAESSYSTGLTNFDVRATFNYDDLIDRDNVSQLYNHYNQKYARPSTSLANAQKYFGMGTYTMKSGAEMHFVSLLPVGTESSNANRKVGYGLDFALKLLEEFYGPGENNIAVNRDAFFKSGTHWSVKAYDKLFKRSFYTFTSPSIVKGLADAQVFPALYSNAFATNGTLGASGGYLNSTNKIKWSPTGLESLMLHSGEDKVSAIHVSRNWFDWTADDVANWLFYRQLIYAYGESSDEMLPLVAYCLVRKIDDEVINLVVPTGTAVSDVYKKAAIGLLTNTASNHDHYFGFPKVIDITNDGLSTAGGLVSDDLINAYVNNEELIIRNCHAFETRRALFLMGNASTAVGSKASIAQEGNDNDNDNDGDVDS